MRNIAADSSRAAVQGAGKVIGAVLWDEDAAIGISGRMLWIARVFGASITIVASRVDLDRGTYVRTLDVIVGAAKPIVAFLKASE